MSKPEAKPKFKRKYKKPSKPFPIVSRNHPKMFAPGELADRVLNAKRNIGISIDPEHRRMLELIAERHYRVNSFSHTIRLMTIDTFEAMLGAGMVTRQDLIDLEEKEKKEVASAIA